VNRDIPVITVLLSKDPVDTNLPGYWCVFYENILTCNLTEF